LTPIRGSEISQLAKDRVGLPERTFRGLFLLPMISVVRFS
jgi:hypothetical protein